MTEEELKKKNHFVTAETLKISGVSKSGYITKTNNFETNQLNIEIPEIKNFQDEEDDVFNEDSGSELRVLPTIEKNRNMRLYFDTIFANLMCANLLAKFETESLVTENNGIDEFNRFINQNMIQDPSSYKSEYTYRVYSYLISSILFFLF